MGILDGLTGKGEDKDKVGEKLAEAKSPSEKATQSDEDARSNSNNRGSVLTKEKEGMKKEKTGWFIIKFTKDHGSYKKGDTETYHISTATALVDKLEVAEIVQELEKYVPKKENK